MSSSPGATVTGATTDPAMMRSPRLELGPVGGQERPTNATVVGGALGRLAPAPPLAGLGHDGDHGPGSMPGTSSPKITPRWQMLPARTGSMSSKGRSRSTSSSAGASPATPAVVTDADGDLDLDRRRPPSRRDDGRRRAHAGVDQVPDDGVIEAEDLLDGRGVEPDLPAHRRGPGSQLGLPAGQQCPHAAGDGSGCRGRPSSESRSGRACRTGSPLPRRPVHRTRMAQFVLQRSLRQAAGRVG